MRRRERMNKITIMKGIYLLSLIVLGVMLVYTIIHTDIEYNRLIEISVLVAIGVVLTTYGLLSIEISTLESKIDKLAWLTEDDETQ